MYDAAVGHPFEALNAYELRHLGSHLHDADRDDQLRRLLLNLDWMDAKISRESLLTLLSDYDLLSEDRVISEVLGALRLSAQVVADAPAQLRRGGGEDEGAVIPGDRDQLSSQLVGRLGSSREPEVLTFLRRTKTAKRGPWLCPLRSSLAAPGGGLTHSFTASGGVNSLAITADATRAVSGGEDGSVCFWDLAGGTGVQAPSGHSRPSGVCMSADGRRAISWEASELYVWDASTNSVMRTLDGGYVMAVAVSADGGCAVSAAVDDEILRLWDVESGTLMRTVRSHDDYVRAVAIAADGSRAVSGGVEAGVDCTVRVWDVRTGALIHILRGHDDSVEALAVSADGTCVVSAGRDRRLCVWDLATGACIHRLEGHTETVQTLAISADGRRAVSGAPNEGGKFLLWDLATGVLVRAYEGHTHWINAVAISADGSSAVSGASDGTVRIWDLDASAPLAEPHTGAVEAVAVSPEGDCAATGGSDGYVRFWNLADGAFLRTLEHGANVRSVAIPWDGGCAISCGGFEVRIWDLDTGALIHSLDGDIDYGATNLAASADGRWIVASGSFGTVRVWDLDDGTQGRTAGERIGWARPVAVSLDGTRAVFGGEAATLCVCDLGSNTRIGDEESSDVAPTPPPVGPSPSLSAWLRPLGTAVAVARGVRASLRQMRATPRVRAVGAAISLDGKRAISGADDGGIAVWDLTTGFRLHTLVGHPAEVSILGRRPEGGRAVAISADGGRAVSGDYDLCVRAWDSNAGTLLYVLEGHTARIQAVAISADGAYAVSGALDGVIIMWDLCDGCRIASFTSDQPIASMAASVNAKTVVAGTPTGAVHILRLVNSL